MYIDDIGCFLATIAANSRYSNPKAIQMTIEKLPIGDIEPPNPFQVMLLQLMQDKMATNPAKVIARDEQGLFTAESETESK